MGVEHAPKTFAHRVGSYKDIHVVKFCTACKGSLFCRSPPLWAMGVEHAPKIFAHRVGSYKDNPVVKF